MDVMRAETVDAELDRLITRRASQDRRPDPDEREESWKASVRAHNARIRAENRAVWCEYHRAQAEALRRALEALIARHEEAAERLNIHAPKGDPESYVTSTKKTDERKTA